VPISAHQFCRLPLTHHKHRKFSIRDRVDESVVIQQKYSANRRVESCTLFVWQIKVVYMDVAAIGAKIQTLLRRSKLYK